MKWGEYSNDVQFILQWNDGSNKANKSRSLNNSVSSTPNNLTIDSPEKPPDNNGPSRTANFRYLYRHFKTFSFIIKL